MKLKQWSDLLSVIGTGTIIFVLSMGLRYRDAWSGNLVDTDHVLLLGCAFCFLGLVLGVSNYGENRSGILIALIGLSIYSAFALTVLSRGV